MTARFPRARVTGWLLAGATAATLLGGAAALALVAERAAPALVLDLGTLPPMSAVEPIAALADAAPLMSDMAPSAPVEPAPPETTPDLPTKDVAPKRPSASVLSPPTVDIPATADLSMPPPPEAFKKEASAKTQPEPKPEPEPEPTLAQPKKAPEPAVEKASVAASPKVIPDAATATVSSTPQIAPKTRDPGGMSPATYAKAVLKRVRATRTATGVGKGTVVVGFTINADGSLSAVQVMQGSGNATLDQIALDHIRRAAPFPAPPAEAGRSYSFEFVGK